MMTDVGTDHEPTANPWLALVEIIELFSQADSLQDIAQVIRCKARDLTNADGVTFVIREGDLCHYIEEDAIGPLWKGRKFPMVSCISGWCMANKRTAVVPDIYVDDRVPYGAYKPTFVKSLVMVPVRADDPLAAIGFYWAHEHRPGDQTLALIEGMARATAAGIVNVQLRQALADMSLRMDTQQQTQ